jgi:hypothetical protein
MDVEYVLKDNVLTGEDVNDFYAMVVNQKTFTEEDLAQDIADSNIGISKAEALAMLEARAKIITKRLQEGYSVNTQLAHYHPVIQGVYHEGEYPSEVTIKITAAKKVAEIAKLIKVRKVEQSAVIHIEQVQDTESGTTNDKITKGGTVKIFGYNLKVEDDTPPDASVGVDFISISSGSGYAYRVPANRIVVNKPKELHVIAPSNMLTGEKVKIRVTTKYPGSGGKPLKTPRTITFFKEFTVVVLPAEEEGAIE